MTDSQATPRPGTGHDVILVRIGEVESTISAARVIFDRGRGMVVEVQPGGQPLRKDERVLLVFDAPDAGYWMRSAVTEVLSPTRCYLVPQAQPARMEKREYIRAELEIPAALEGGPGLCPDLVPHVIELSASGFRCMIPSAIPVGAEVRILLALPTTPPRTVSLRSQVLRSGNELAGRFLDVSPEDRLALAGVVFRARMAELGLGEI